MEYILKRQFGHIARNPLMLPIKMLHFVGAILLLPVTLVIRLLRPIVHIRFGRLPNTRIGGFATCPELYLCERDKNAKPTIDLFCCHKDKNCNSQLKKMWERKLRTFDFANVFIWSNKLLPGHKEHLVPMPDENDFKGLLAASKPHLRFTEEEERLGRDILKERGISLDKKFICFAARDASYLKTTHDQDDWNYHGYRDVDIDHYLPAAKELTKRNFKIFRMGAIVAKPLSIRHPEIVDYATTFRSDFLDIFLLSKCHFFFGAHSGMNSVSMIFRRPKAVTDVISLHSVHTWMPDDLFIPKKLWLKKEDRFLTFNEMIDMGAWKFTRSQEYTQCGLEVINNTPDEVSALAIEMDERLNGTWKATDEDEALQKTFWKIFNKGQTHGNPVSRIGAEFLRQNRELLN